MTDKAKRRIAEWRDLRAELAAWALDQLSASDRKALSDASPTLLRLAARLDEENR